MADNIYTGSVEVIPRSGDAIVRKQFVRTGDIAAILETEYSVAVGKVYTGATETIIVLETDVNPKRFVYPPSAEISIPSDSVYFRVKRNQYTGKIEAILSSESSYHRVLRRLYSGEV